MATETATRAFNGTTIASLRLAGLRELSPPTSDPQCAVTARSR